MSSEKTVDYKISADPSDFLAGFRRAVAGAKESSSQIKEAVGGIRETLEGLQGLMAGFGAALAGGLVGEFVKANIEMQDQFRKSAQAAGVTTEQFSGMAYAAKLANVDAESLSKGYIKLGQALTNAQQGQKLQVDLFKQLKLDPSQFKDADEVLGAVSDRFANMADGAAKTSLAVDLFGERIGPQLIPLLNEGRSGLSELKKEAADLGVVVSTQAGEQAEKFNDTMTRLGEGARGLGMQISNQLLPSMQEMATQMLSAVPTAIEATRAAINTGITVMTSLGDTVGTAWGLIRDAFASIASDLAEVFGSPTITLMQFFKNTLALIETAFIGLRVSVQLAANYIVSVFDRLAAAGRMLGGVLYSAIHLDWQGITASWSAYKAETTKSMQDTVDAAVRIASKGRDDIQAALMGEHAKAPSAAPSEGHSANPFVAGVKPSQVVHHAAAKSQMPLFESALEAEKRGYAEIDALRGMSKQAELDYWNGILSTAKLSEADRLAVAKQAAQARVRVLQEEAQQAQQLQGISLQDWQTAELAKVTQDEEAAKTRVALGQETQAQLLAEQQLFEDRRHAIQLAALRADLATLDPQRDPVKVAQVNSKIETLEQTHQLKLAQIRSQVAVQSAAQQKVIWDNLGQSINSLWNNGVQALMQGTLTWRNAMKAIGTELVGWFANSVVEPMVVKSIFGEQAKTAATAAGTAERWAIESAAAAKSVALWAATAIKNIMTSAWEAMAAAWKAIVGIPYVGPVLAPIAAGAAFAGVAAIAGNIASAEGGYDIPGTINPMVQLHKREMVLPAGLADRVRNMTGGGGSGGLTVHVHHNIQALDGASVKRVLVDNSDAVAAAVKKAVGKFQHL